MYIINTIPHRKCFVRYLRTRCFCIRNLTRSLRSLVRFLIRQQLVRKYRTPALFMKYSLYACPVFHHSLPQYLSNEMERLQYNPTYPILRLEVALDITSLYERRKALSNALFDQIVRDQSHKFHDLLPPRNGSTYCTRSQRYFKLPICKTNRFYCGEQF